MQTFCVHSAFDQIPRAQSLHRIRSGRSAAVVFGMSIENAMSRKWPLSVSFPDDRVALPAEAGVVLDRTAASDGSWWIGAESGLYHAGVHGVERLELPVRDPFVLCVRPFEELWVGTGVRHC